MTGRHAGFWIDTSDPPYPKIRPAGSPDHGGEELLTLKEAKARIIEDARNLRQHWLAVIHRTKELTVHKIIDQEVDLANG